MNNTNHKNNITDKIKAVIEKIRPFINEDGGDVEFVSFNAKTGIVEVQLQGHCVGCPLSMITLKQSLEKNIRQAVPDVQEVIAV